MSELQNAINRLANPTATSWNKKNHSEAIKLAVKLEQENKALKEADKSIFDYLMDVCANTDDAEFAQRLHDVAETALLEVNEGYHRQWKDIVKLQAENERLKAENKRLQVAARSNTRRSVCPDCGTTVVQYPKAVDEGISRAIKAEQQRDKLAELVRQCEPYHNRVVSVKYKTSDRKTLRDFWENSHIYKELNAILQAETEGENERI